MNPSKVYFPSLDVFRAMAILLVLTGHFAAAMDSWGGYGGLAFLDWLSIHGLVLFFVLSGFLITYLLLKEQQYKGRIDIPRFYGRRMLRIWPLYYLIVGIGQFLIPYTGLLGFPEIDRAVRAHFWSSAGWYLLFLPNVPFLLRHANVYIYTTWSIGVEEQYYLLWPWALTLLRKRLLVLLPVMILLWMISAWLYVYSGGHGAPRWPGRLNALFYWSNIGYFSLGGLMACIRLQRPRWMCLLSRPVVQILVPAAALPLLCGQPLPLQETGLAVLFALLIGQATQTGTLVESLRPPTLRYLGKISYGMYIFHAIVLMAVCRMFRAAGGVRHPMMILATFVAGLTLTIGAGALSYRVIESYFLRLKDRLH